jgi:hypothetical protein
LAKRGKGRFSEDDVFFILDSFVREENGRLQGLADRLFLDTATLKEIVRINF